MISLGINLGHDRGVAIVKDGCLIGAIAQERIDRIKHSPSILLPYQAIDHLLEYLNISFKEIAYVGISSTAVNAKDLLEYYSEQLSEHYKTDAFKMVAIPHHLSHAYAAYYTSDFENSVILVADGGGEIRGLMEESESIFIVKGKEIVLAEQRLQNSAIHPMSRAHNYLYPFMNKDLLDTPISIGKKYEQITQLIGLGSHGEGKTMGLAAYGNDIFDKQILPLSNINFDLTFGDILKEIEEDYSLSDLTFYEYISKKRANIAQSMQKYAENQVLAIIKYIVAKYNIKNICLAGGLFLNCPINHKILELDDSIKLHICPATGDDGQSIGNAFAAYHKFNSDIKNTSSVLPYLGISYTNEQIQTALKEKNLRYQYMDNKKLSETIAHEIYNNKIVGFFYGRSEIGPRALCHRSLLANPCWDSMKDYLNNRVKHRENFRPFAPAVKSESQFDIFTLKQESPYMLLSAQVNDKYLSKIPSVTHVDGSARVQAVYKEGNELMYLILEEFEKLSGIPVILNTSFNDNGEPIVEKPEDAIKTFLLTNIDILVLENYIVYKEHNI